MQKRQTVAAIVATILLWAAPAYADMKLMLKGGLGWYTGDLGNVTSGGPVWGLAMSYELLGLAGIELAYEGSRNSLSDLAAVPSTGLLRNGFSGMVKVSPPLIPLVSPYIAAGLGGSYVTIQGQGDTTHYQNGFTLEAPIAIGTEFNFVLVTVGIRATYRIFLTQQFAFPTGSGRGNLFDVTAMAGLSF